MLTLLIVLSPFTLIGAAFVGFLALDKWDERKCRYKSEPLPYDKDSPFIQRLQFLANIRPYSYFRDRFNNVRGYTT